MRTIQPKELEKGLRVWLYSRLSRDEDVEQNSLQNQRKILVDYCESKEYLIVGESEDDNKTGMNFEREGIRKISDAVEAGLVDAVLVKDLSRLGRHKVQTAIYIDHLHGHGVRVLSATESIDSFNEDDDLIIGFKQILNDFYAKDISKKVRFGIRQKQKDSGMVVVPPFGYFKDKNTGKIIVIDECAQLIRKIYTLYLEGLGYKKIAKHLNDLSYKAPAYYQLQINGKRAGNCKTKMSREYMWNERTVERILTNPSYHGTLVCHKTVTSKIYGTHKKTADEDRFHHKDYYPVIVDREVWDRVQAARTSRKAAGVKAPRNQPIHAFAGLLRCAECDASFTAKRRKYKDREYVEYICNTYHRMGKDYCVPHRVNEQDLKDLLYAEITTLKERAAANWERIKHAADRCDGFNRAKEQQIRVLTEQVEALTAENRNLFRLLSKLPEDEEEIMATVRENKARMDALGKQIAERENEALFSEENQDKLRASIDLLGSIVCSQNLCNSVIALLVDKIVIRRVGRDSIDAQVQLKGIFKSHMEIYDQLMELDEADSDENIHAVVELLERVTA